MNAMDLRLITEESKEAREKMLTEQATKFYNDTLLPLMVDRAKRQLDDIRINRVLAHNAVSIPHLLKVLENNGFFVDDGINEPNIVKISW